MFPGAPAQPIDGAIVNNTAMHNTGGTSNFTTCFNITVGVLVIYVILMLHLIL
jgi:hypothetical protein